METIDRQKNLHESLRNAMSNHLSVWHHTWREKRDISSLCVREDVYVSLCVCDSVYESEAGVCVGEGVSLGTSVCV